MGVNLRIEKENYDPKQETKQPLKNSNIYIVV